MGIITPEQYAKAHGIGGGAASGVRPADIKAVSLSPRETRSFLSRNTRPDVDNMNAAIDQRAEAQGFFEDLGNTLARGIIGAAGVALEDLSYMTLQPVGEMLGVLDEWEQNILASHAAELKESGRELFPNYKRHDASIWNGWDIISDLVENGLGFAIPGGLASRGIGALTKAAKVQRLNGYVSALTGASAFDAGLATIGAGVAMNYAEGTMMGMETYKSLLEEGYSKDEAAEAADRVRNMNRALMATDIFQLHGIFRGIRSTRNTLANPAAWRENLKSAFTTLNADNPVYQGLVEGFEEVTQGLFQREAEEGVRQEMTDKTLMSRINEYFKDESLWYEGALGLLSGGVQSKGAEAVSTLFDIRNANKIKQQIDNVEQALSKETDPAKKELLIREIENLQNKYETQTKMGAYEAQQKLITGDNAQYLENHIDSLMKQEVLMNQAVKEGKDNAQEIIGTMGFSSLFFRNAEKGTVDSLERALTDLRDSGMSVEEAAKLGYSENYVEQAQQHLDSLKEMEREYLQASNYANPASLFFEMQAKKLKQKLANSALDEQTEVAKKIKGKAAYQNLNINNALQGIPQPSKEDEPKSVKDAREKALKTFKADPDVKKYHDLADTVDQANEMITEHDEKIDYLKSSAYAREVEKRRKAIEEREQNQEKKALQKEKQFKEQTERNKVVEDSETIQPPTEKQEAPRTEETKEEVEPEVVPEKPKKSLKEEVLEELKQETKKETSDDIAADILNEMDEAEQVEEAEETPELTEAEKIAAEILGEIDEAEKVEDVHDSKVLIENAKQEGNEDLSTLYDENSAAELQEDLNESQKKPAETDDAHLKSPKITTKTHLGSSREGNQLKFSTQTGQPGWEEADAGTRGQAIRNILNIGKSDVGTKIYFEIDYDSDFFSDVVDPPKSNRKYSPDTEEYSQWVSMGVPIKILNENGEVLGYLPALLRDAVAGGKKEKRLRELMNSPLGQLREKIVSNPHQKFTSEITSRDNGVFLRTGKGPNYTMRDVNEAIPDKGTLLVKKTGAELIYSSPTENVDPIAIDQFVKEGFTYLVLPDGGVIPLFKKRLETKHVQMLSRAIVLAVQIQKNGLDRYKDNDVYKQFKNAGYDLSNFANLQKLLKQYVYIANIDKGYNLETEDRKRFTSSLTKFMFETQQMNRTLLTIEPNGVALSGPFSANEITPENRPGISISKNSPESMFNDELVTKIESILSNMFYNTDVDLIQGNKEFVDISVEDGNIIPNKTNALDFVRSTSRTNVVGMNVGTEENPYWSYRANPVVKFKMDTGVAENEEFKVQEEQDASIGEPPTPKTSSKKNILRDKVGDVEISDELIFGDDSLGSRSVSIKGMLFGDLRMRNIVNNQGFVTNERDFYALVQKRTIGMSKRLSESLGQPVTLQSIAHLGPNNEVIMNKQTVDFYELVRKGVTARNQYLLDQFPWLKDNEYVRNATLEQVNQMKKHKIICG